MVISNPNDWYQQLCSDIRKSKSKCCKAPVEDAGTCYEGCCDRWRCTKCGKTWLQEVGD